MEGEVYSQVKVAVRKLLNINLDYYKDEQMKRRLDSWLIRSGSVDWPLYFSRLSRDQQELAKFRDYLTINVSSFFRDPERWQALKQNILPDLLQDTIRSRPGFTGLRCWSAGCSIGPEPYTLAIVLKEIAPGRNHTILATDLDRGALTRAKNRGPYAAEEIQNFTAGQRQAFLEPGDGPYYLKNHLSTMIEFREHNLVTDSFPGNFDLIICRNVVIYFTTETKEFLYQKFYDALRPGGVLFVGATEIIPRPQTIGFSNNGISFYKRS